MKISVILEMLTANFETDAKRAQKALDKSVREMEQTAKRAGVAIGAGLASAATALGALGVQAINAADKLNDSSQRTGVMVEALSRLKYAAEQSGTSFEVVEKGLQKLAREADSGGKNLARIGVTVADAAGRMRPMNEILLDVSERFAGMGNATEKAAAAQAIFGKAGAALIPMLSEGKAGLQALGDEAERLGVVFSTDAAQAAAAFNDNLDKLKSAATGLGNDIATELLPALLDVTNAAIAFVKTIREDGTLKAWINGIKEAAGYIDELAVFITARLVAGALVGLIGSLATATTGFGLATAAANTFRLALALAGGPLGLLVSGIAAVAVVMYDYEDAADLSKAANDNLRKSIDDLNTATGAAIQPSMDLAAQRKAEAIETLKAAAANLKFAETQLAVAELSRDSDPTSNLEAMLSSDASQRIKELGQEIETTKNLLVEYDAAQAGAADRLRKFKEEAADAGGEVVTLGANTEQLAEKQRLLDEAAKLTAESQQQLAEELQRTADAATQAGDELSRMLDRQAAALGGQGVVAALEYRDALVSIYNWELALQAAGELSEAKVLELAQAREQAGELYRRELDNQAAAERDRIAESDRQSDEYTRIWQYAYDQQSQLFADGLTGQIDSFDSFVDALERIWLRALADMIAAQLRSGLGEFGGGGFGGSGGSASGGGGMLQGLLGSFTGGGGSTGGGSASSGASGFAGAGWMNTAAGAAVGIQGIRSGNVGQGVMGGAMAGMQFGPWGALVGAIIGGLGAAFNKPKPPDFRLGGDSSRVRNPEGEFNTVFGNVNAGSRLISWEELVKPVQEFDIVIRDMVASLGGGSEQVNAIRESLARWSVDLKGDAATVENVLNSRFGAILTTFSADVQGFVGAAGTVQERVSRLADALAIENIVDEGLLGDTFAGVASILTEYRNGTEDIADTYARVLGSVQLLDEALEISGVAISGTRDEIIRLATDITEAAGGLDRATALWGSFFANFYSPEELAQSALNRQRGATGSEFSDIGLSAESFLGAGGARAFRDAFEAALPTLSADEIVQWLEAGDSLVLLSNAIARLAEVAPESADNIAEFMAGISAQLAELSPELSLAEQIAEQRAANDQLIARAIALGATEAQLAEVRELGAARLNGLLEQQNALIAEQEALVASQAAAAADLQSYLANLSAESAGGITPLTSALQNLRGEYQSHIDRINELAIASGRAGASQSELALATAWYSQQVGALVQELISSAQSIIARLYGRAGAASATSSGGFSGGGGGDLGGVQQVADAVDDRYRREMQYLDAISSWLDSLDLSALSPLTPAERLSEAQSTFESLLARAQGGDLDALEQLQGSAQAYLQEAQGYFGGVGAYRGIFDGVQSALRALVDRGPLNAAPVPGGTGSTGGGSTGGMVVEAGDSFVQLSELERFTLANELTGILRDLMAATGSSLVQISEQLGLDLRDLVTDLGVNLDEITVTTTLQLAEISRALGVDLTELASSVGLDLGGLADEQSLMNDALEQVILDLPDGIREQIREYLQAIEDATNDADANAAIQAAEDAINLLPPAIRDLLAPFFGGVSSPTDLLLSTTVAQAADIAAIRALFEGGALSPSGSFPSAGPIRPPGDLLTTGGAVAGDKIALDSKVVDFTKYREEAEALRAEVARGNKMMAAMLEEGNQISKQIAGKVGGSVQPRSR